MKYLSAKKGSIKKCLKRHELRKLANKNLRDPLNIRLREEYHKVLRQLNLRPSKSQEKSIFFHSRLLELRNTVDDSDNKKLWNCPKSMDDTEL